MILYHHSSRTSLHCPSGCNAGTITGLTVESCSTIRNVLLVRNPKDRVKLLYQLSYSPTTIKNWVMSVYIPPCSRKLSNPDYVVRYEWFKRDMWEIGIDSSIVPLPPPEIKLCLTSSVFIRKQFATDYELGDYE